MSSKRLNIVLSEDYKNILIHLGNGAAGCGYGLERLDLKNILPPYDFIKITVSCAISSLVEYIVSGKKKDAVLNALKHTPARLPRLLEYCGLKLDKLSPTMYKKFWGIEDFLNGQSPFYNDMVNKLLGTDEGIRAFANILSRGPKGLPVLSGPNIRKLHEIVLPKFGKNPGLQTVLEKAPDLNRAIKDLAKFAKASGTLDDYTRFMARYADEITIPGKGRISLSKFMDDYYSDAAEAYYAIEAGTINFARLYRSAENNSDEIVEITVKFVETSADIYGRIVTNNITDKYKNEKNDNKEQ